MFYSVSQKQWLEEDHDKDHTIYGLGPRGTWTATMVYVRLGSGKKICPETGRVIDEPRFVKQGVRIEVPELRTTRGDFTIPGLTFFYSYRTGLISETGPARFTGGRTNKSPYPEVAPGAKTPGVAPSRHRFGLAIMHAVGLVEEAAEDRRNAHAG